MKSRAAASRPAPNGGEQKAMSEKAAGLAPGERRLNGAQTTGREYRNLSEPSFAIRRTNNVGVIVARRDDAARRSIPAGFRRRLSGARLLLPLSPSDLGRRRAARLHRGRRVRLLRSSRLRPPDRQRPRHRRLRRRLYVARPAGAGGSLRPHRMGRRPALVRRQCRHARRQLLRDGATRARRR